MLERVSDEELPTIEQAMRIMTAAMAASTPTTPTHEPEPGSTE
jgi:hypothetical protein